MKLFHRTTEQAAGAILTHGFRDAAGTYFTGGRLWTTGVWLSNVPLDCNQGCKGPVLLHVDLEMSDEELFAYEWVADCDQGYREFQVPAAVLNAGCSVRRVTDEEEQLLDESEFYNGYPPGEPERRLAEVTEQLDEQGVSHGQEESMAEGSR